MPKHKYISQELTHFVGRTDENKELKFERLVKILKSGCLKSSLGKDIRRIMLGTISDDIESCPTAVCFCDIPYECLSLHKGKYSEFGISFLKSFLIPKGVSPVFYVAKNATTEYWRDMSDPRGEVWLDANTPRGELFSALREELGQLFLMLQNEYPDNREIDIASFDIRLWRLFYHLTTDVFSFIKIFDDNLEEEDVNNFYMEREWRATSNIGFSLCNVKRVLLPNDYILRFKSLFPEYTGNFNDLKHQTQGRANHLP